MVAAWQALAYGRCRRVIGAEAGKIAPGALDALVERLRATVST